jgi:phosphate-selective porin OprO and OprP
MLTLPNRSVVSAKIRPGSGRAWLFSWRVQSSLQFAALVVVLLSSLSGCKKSSEETKQDVPVDSSHSGSAARGLGGDNNAVANSLQTSAEVEARLAALTNQFAAAQQAQAETIQKLLNRIEQLERQGSNRIASAQTVSELQHAQTEQLKADQKRAAQLQAQIKELESKVGSLQAGRVLPEIALPAEDGPTQRDLDQKIRILERKNELAAEAAEAKAKEAPRLSVGANGFTLSSADTNFVLRLRGELQLDSRTFIDDNPNLQGNDGFLLRRARPILEGTVFRDFDFLFVPDFAGSSVQIFDASMNYRYRPELQLKAGKFKGPVGFEQLQSDTTLPFNERSLVSDFIATRNVGVQLWGDVAKGRLSYAAGVFNESGDGRNPGSGNLGDGLEVAGKLGLMPFKDTSVTALQGLGIGAGGSYSDISSNAAALPSTTGGTLAGYITTGQQQLFAYNPLVGTVVADGPHWRVSPYLTYVHGPFGVLGEYGISHQGVLNTFSHRRAELNHTAWEVSGQWVLTGEPASFTGINPKRPFDLRNGGWGAWQLVGRFAQLDLDNAAFQGFSNPASSASGATAWSVGVNWWLNKNVRLLTSFSRTTFHGGGLDSISLTPPATVTFQPENVFFTRLQLAF